MSDTANEIKSRIDIVDLISETVKLKKSGHSYTGFCPFHDNLHTPSFVVWQDTGTWKCFGACNTGGDHYSFVMKRDGIEFRDALELLARRAGIELRPLTETERTAIKRERERQDATNELLARATDFFFKQLWTAQPGSDKALTFARSRGLNDQHLKAIRWGFSRSDDALLKAMMSSDEGATLLPLAREIGLIRSDGRDFTANADGDKVSPAGWLIYPCIMNGRVTWMTARACGEIKQGSKSRNLPLSQMLGSRQIYRADHDLWDGQAADQDHPRGRRVGPILRDDGLVLVEGPADAETCRAWGWPAWAMLGAPVNEEENKALVDDIRKRAERGTLYAAMSNDTAGLNFANKISEMIGPLTRIVFWPKPEGAKKGDANDWLTKQNATTDDVTQLFEESFTYLDIQIQQAASLRDVRKKAENIEHLADLVVRLDSTERRIYINSIGDRKGLDISRREFEKMVGERLSRSNSSGVKVVNGELTWWSEPLINALPRVESEFIIDDGHNTPTIQYHITGKLAGGQPLPGIDVDAGEFDGMKWIGKQWGARVFAYLGSSKNHLLKRAILENSLPTLKRETMYTFTGWYTVGSERSYLTASGALSSKGLNDGARVDLPNNLSYYSLPKPPTGPDLIEAIQASLRFIDIAPDTITATLWSAMYTAVMTSVKSLNAVLWVYGPTQSKKSTISHLAISHFGERFVQGRDYKAPKDWTSTAADMEVTLFTCKDVPVILDDYAPQFTSSKEAAAMAKAAHYIVRSVGNRSSRGRRQADMSARAQFLPRGLVIATAEQPLSGQSIVGRTITIPVEFSNINLDRLSACQAEHALYSQAMAGYVAWLAENWDMACAEFQKIVLASQERMRGVFSNQDRLTDYYSALNAGSRLALMWMREVGALSEVDAESRATLNDVALCELLSGQSTRISQQSPVLKFFQALDDMLTQGKVVLAPKEIDSFAVPHDATLIGWWNVKDGDAHIYLMTAPALKEVKNFWAGLDERFDTLMDALRREMWQFGYLVNRDKEQIEPSKWINKEYGTRRVLWIDAEKVYKELNVDILKLHKETDGDNIDFSLKEGATSPVSQ